VVRCSGTNAHCECSGDRQCAIVCEAASDCKDSRLLCAEGFDCAVVCEHSACGKARVSGPIGADLRMYCDGDSSCGDAVLDTEAARHLFLSCGGKDACKGAHTVVNCGGGHCELQFSGESAGSDALILPHDATAFECVGRYAQCPANYVAPCNTATQCSPAQLFNDAKCRCECPARAGGTECPRDHRWSEQSCSCEMSCPYAPPTAEECAFFGLLPMGCECVPSNFCCHSALKRDRGICWGAQSEAECSALSSELCWWDPRQCHGNPPQNDFAPQPRGCHFQHALCRWDGDCCSEYCALNGRCL